MTKTNLRRALLSLSVLATLAATPALAESDNHNWWSVRVPGTDMDTLGRPMMPEGQDQREIFIAPAPPAPVYRAAPVYAPAPVYRAPAPVYRTPAAHGPQVLDENQIERRLARQGYIRIHDIEYKRGHYTASARDDLNRPVMLVVSAQSGQVLDVRYVR